MLTVSFIGLGNRGGVYAQYFAKNAKVKMAACCDVCAQNLVRFQEEFGGEKENCFLNEEEFFAQKRSDLLVVATTDSLHLRHALRGLELGYDLLLEKPVAPNLEDTEIILRRADALQRKVIVCHNLRYTPFYQSIKLLVAEGKIGEILSVEQAENVAYYHFLASFVRGKWHNSKESSPVILQKCCHDLDIINWLVGKKCENLTSFGGLHFYCEKSAPKDSAHYCVDCKKTDCTYNAVNIYTKYHEMLCVPYGFDYSDENIRKYLSERTHHYGDCAFYAGNDVCDRQTVNMVFEGGITASLIMQGFAGTVTDRYTVVYGSKGRIEGRFNEGKLKVEIFGEEEYEIDVRKQILDGASHNGGDAKLVADVVEYLTGAEKPLGISFAVDSLYSHKLAFVAEESRVLGGAPCAVE